MDDGRPQHERDAKFAGTLSDFCADVGIIFGRRPCEAVFFATFFRR